MRAQGADGRIDGDGNASGAKHHGGGFALGADRWLRDDLLLGLAAGYGHDQADTATGNVDVDSYQVAAYGRWQPAAYYLDASLGYGHHHSDVTRHIGFLGQRADAGYGGDSVNLALEAGWPLAHGQATLTPYAGLSAAWWRRGNSAESGAGAANLDLATQKVDSQRSHLGLRYTWNGMRFAPTADVAWVHEFGDVRVPVDARFASFTSATDFRIHGPELDRDRLALALGLAAWQEKNLRLDIGYRGEFAGSDREHTATATLHWAW
jgi:outer membrane autotransporter protein